RASILADELIHCEDLYLTVHVDAESEGLEGDSARFETVSWHDLVSNGDGAGHSASDRDIAAIFYTSGSTGKPKGVVLSHLNMVCGARSVAEYLKNESTDRLLAALPFSFDYGFSQLSTAFCSGASVALMEYLWPKDVLRAAEKFAITGLAAVPPLWIQLAELEWPDSVAQRLRYITNSGGAMPVAVTEKLREALPSTDIYLMYGLTEAFRSTYLPPAEVSRRPTSMGKAIPNAEILVVRPDGEPCEPGEIGELVHCGDLVSRGYWNDPERTAERFRPAPGNTSENSSQELAVWSGDSVKMDEEGYLYFIGRKDDMIKTSGYRISPNEIEEVIYATGLAKEAVAIGVPHSVLGQAVVVVGVPETTGADAPDELIADCQRALPAFMVPRHVEWRESLPRNSNGKIDRKSLAGELENLFGNDRDD
ncbi:MAG: acyl-CoA ligase (AMP-forming), exosortase A system-associated, partial [Gammaproteobacteria bacterium]